MPKYTISFYKKNSKGENQKVHQIDEIQLGNLQYAIHVVNNYWPMSQCDSARIDIPNGHVTMFNPNLKKDDKKED